MKIGTKVSIFLFFIVLVSLSFNKDAWAYGENINGSQTHYEIQKQYIRGDKLVIEGFYYVYELQNFTDNTRGSGTHYYYIELNSGISTNKYFDTGGYYIDLTNIEYKSGYPWASSGESDIAIPNVSGFNYRYKDIGFQFVIPLTDLRSFQGTHTTFNLKIACVATNTINGRGVELAYTQQNIYASTIFNSLPFQDYNIMPKSNLNKWGSNIFADVGYVRTAPSKSASTVQYSGKTLYWGLGETFWDLSQNTTVASNSSDMVTWYYLQYGNIFYDGTRYRARYAQSGQFGWIPSVFMGTLSGTPYTITVTNTPPVITANDITVNEATLITKDLLLKDASTYDYSFGTKKPSIVSTNIVCDTDRNRAGTYSVTYSATDINNATTTKTVNINVVNIPPTITSSDKSWDEARAISDDMLLENVTASDPYDGDLTSQIVITDKGGLDQGKAKAGTYQVSYAVTDSNAATTNKTVTVTINNVPPEITIIESYEYLYGTTMTEQRVKKLIIAASDVYDGDLTSQVTVADLGGLLLDDTSNWHKPYTVTYAVTDSNGATTTQTGIIQITYKYIRSISAKSLYTVEEDSKWKKSDLFSKLSTIILKNPKNDNECEQVWYFSNEDRLAIQQHVVEYPMHSEESNKWFLDNYTDRKMIDHTK